MGVALALALLLLAAQEASAGNYSVAQCGWHVGIDATWADDTGGTKFRPESRPRLRRRASEELHPGRLDGLRHALRPLALGGAAGTGISRVRGTWWHALHDGMEQRLGVGTWNGASTLR